MRSSTQRCSQKWQTLTAGSLKTFLVLFLLSFLVTSTNAQIPGQINWCDSTSGAGYVSKPHLIVHDVLNGTGDDTEFNQGTKDVSPLSDWHWGLGNISAKTDLGNVGVIIDGACNLYFMADRYASEGDADLGLWLFKDDVSLNPDGTFSGTHTAGDLLITSKFTNGGGNQFVRVYVWTSSGELDLIYDTQDPSFSGLGAEDLSGVVNSAPMTACFPYQGKNQPAQTYNTGTFFEGHVDLCEILRIAGGNFVIDPCFSNFIFKTSQSQEPTSANGDLVFGSINSIPADKTVNGGAYCSGDNGFNITLSNASAGVSYQLQKWNAGTSTWDNVGAAKTGAAGSTIDFDGLQLAGSYRVFATTVGTQCSKVVGTAEVTAITANGGTGSADQTVCSGGDPSVLSVTGASTGTYQWQSNTTGCNGTWVDINSATGATYDPASGFTTTTYYRRKTTVTSGATTCIAYSTCITVYVNNVNGGTGSADQTVCSGGDPAVLSVTGSSASGTPSYQWQSNTTGCGSAFTNITGATSATYDPPSGLTSTTYYRRVTKSTLNGVECTANSTCITVTVNNVNGGAASANQTLCGPADPGVISVTGSSASGTPTYQWQSKPGTCEEGGTWNNITGATGASYDPPSGQTATTSYRRTTISTLNGVQCTANSTCMTVFIGGVTPGSIAASQTLCSPADPAAFTSVTGATGATTPTYQWQKKLGDCASNNAWENISGATSATYDAPSGLTATTSYQRVATSTLNGQNCSAASNCITVTVKPTPAPPYLVVVNNCNNSTITAYVSNGGAAVAAGELTWSNGMTGNPIIVTTTTAVTATRTVDGCPSGTSNSVTPAPKPTPGAPTGVPNSGCIGQQISLGATGCSGTLKWYATNSSTTVLFTGTPFVTPALNESTTYYVSCTVDGCEGPRTAVTASVTACGAFCTYTQGAWGSEGGKMCDGETGGYSTIGLLNKILSQPGWNGSLSVGWGSNKVQINSACILALLPGGGNSYTLTGTSTTCDQIKAKYAKQLNNGTYKINNTLLAQTITLGLNLGINGNLSSFSFATHSATNKYLITQDLVSCGSTSVVPNSSSCTLIDPAVIALLKQASWPASGNGDFPATVAGLYSLANYALGGGSLAGTNVTLESIAGVVDAINNAFDECRAFVGFSATCPTTSSRIVTTPLVTETSVMVATSPNPYTDRIRFEITSKVSGQASLEVYNLTGHKVSVPFQGYINAGRSKVVVYNVPASLQGSLIYKVTVNNKFASGKVLRIGK